MKEKLSICLIFIYKFSCILFILLSLNTITEIKCVMIVANMKRSDGFGANIEQIIGGGLYAELHGFPFVYQPLETMEHNYQGHSNDPEFIKKKEWLINCIGNMPTVNDTAFRNCHFYTNHFQGFLSSNVDKCKKSAFLKKLKKIFRANKNIADYFNTKFFNVALHIRRRNPHDTRNYGTDIPNCIYLDAICRLRKIYAKNHPIFHIYSQGDINDFNEFRAPDIVLHINESDVDAYAAMVLADVLVMGRSSFSYTAGILSNGIVYYVPYMLAPLPNWKSLEKLIGKEIGGVDLSEKLPV